jgi:hypothetical protein
VASRAGIYGKPNREIRKLEQGITVLTGGLVARFQRRKVSKASRIAPRDQIVCTGRRAVIFDIHKNSQQRIVTTNKAVFTGRLQS